MELPEASFDVQTIWQKLTDFSRQVSTLPWKSEYQSDDLNTTKKEHGELTFKNSFQHVWHEMKQIVIVRHRQDSMPMGFLSNQDKRLIIALLQQQIAQTQMALLQRQSEIYQGSLTTIAATLAQYFDTTAASVKQANTFIHDLQQIKITLPENQFNALILQVQDMLAEKSAKQDQSL